MQVWVVSLVDTDDSELGGVVVGVYDNEGAALAHVAYGAWNGRPLRDSEYLDVDEISVQSRFEGRER